jgi:hypothetical protein
MYHKLIIRVDSIFRLMKRTNDFVKIWPKTVNRFLIDSEEIKSILKCAKSLGKVFSQAI